LNWYLTVSIEAEQPILHKTVTEPIGIDLGIKELATISTGETIKNINKTKNIRRLSKKLKRLQRQVSRHYEKL
jgi:putative transposase